MEISRKKELESLILRKHNGMIKVITGIRRCGKTYLLFNIFKNHLLAEGVAESHIISINLDSMDNENLRDRHALYNFINSKIVDSEMHYVLLDEIQLVEGFEGVLNSLLHKNNLDVYVTGSNSKFLSKDIITEFRGRGDEVHVYPITFSQFMTVYNGDMYQGLSAYMMYGGLPTQVLMATDQQKQAYLKTLFETTYIKDIIERNKIEKIGELNSLINILASSVGSLSNPSKIASTFKSVIDSSISDNTVRQYIEFLKDAFIVKEANRYDVKGRNYIGTPLKYYFEDVGLRNARLGFRQFEENHLMENIIYLELLYRGFSVDVGVVEKREKDGNGASRRTQYEIDFVANLGSRRYYIQSAFNIYDEQKRKQEKASLISVGDSFKKIIIVKDVIKPWYDDDGILTMSIYDFLLDDASLNSF